MADPAHSFEQPHERKARLFELGIDEQALATIAHRGLAARRACTPFDPPSYPGVHQWAQMHRAARELLAVRGWAPDDSRNFSRVVRSDGAVALTIATGDENTGLHSEPGVPQPTTKYPKGTETDLAITVNRQLRLWHEAGDLSIDVDTERPRRQTWWLLFAQVATELRFELSLPAGQDDRGHIHSWTERIIFEPISLESYGNEDDDDPGPTPIDVPVERL